MSLRCTTHFHACDCREEKFKQVEKENDLLQSWVKHHQKSVELKFAEVAKLQKENEELREELTFMADMFLSTSYTEENGKRVFCGDEYVWLDVVASKLRKYKTKKSAPSLTSRRKVENDLV